MSALVKVGDTIDRDMRRFTRGQRRQAARTLANMRKLSHHEVWEKAYRLPIAEPAGPSIADRVVRFLVRHIVTPDGLLIHPTKGWRRAADGLPMGRKAWA